MKRFFTHLISWIVALSFLGVMLRGRYAWEGGHSAYAARAWLLSFYFVTLLTPLTYYTTVLLSARPRLALGIASGVGLALTFPHRWLGLDRFFFPLETDFFLDASTFATNQLDWFPQALQHLPAYPNEVWLLLALSAVGSALLFLVLRKQPRKFLLGAVFCFQLLILQTWLHTSLRSPYTYIPHFEQTSEKNYWYHYYLYPSTQQAAVNRDYGLFIGMERTFTDAPQTTTGIMDRSLPHYLSSQLVRFFHPYPTWIVLNILWWSVIVWAVFSLASQWWNRSVGIYAALLSVLGQGFLLYAAQPMGYIAGLATIPLIFLAYEKIFNPRTFRFAHVFIFAGILSLGALSYSFQPWFLILLLLSCVRRRFILETAVSILVAILLARGFVLLSRSVEGLQALSAIPHWHNPLSGIRALWKQGQHQQLLLRLLESPVQYLRRILHGFQLSFLLALLGCFTIFKSSRWKEISLFLFAGMMIFLPFHLAGNIIYSDSARIIFSIYPAVFFLSAIALEKISQKSTLLVVLFLMAQFLWINVDVLGAPWIYYLWFTIHPGHAFSGI